MSKKTNPQKTARRWPLAISGACVMMGNKLPFSIKRINLYGMRWTRGDRDLYVVSFITPDTCLYAYDYGTEHWYGVPESYRKRHGNAERDYGELVPKARVWRNREKVDVPLSVETLHSHTELELLIHDGLVAVLEKRIERSRIAERRQTAKILWMGPDAFHMGFNRGHVVVANESGFYQGDIVFKDSEGRILDQNEVSRVIWSSRLGGSLYNSISHWFTNPIINEYRSWSDEVKRSHQNWQAKKAGAKPWQVERGFRADGKRKRT